jgi:hypothetical protein
MENWKREDKVMQKAPFTFVFEKEKPGFTTGIPCPWSIKDEFVNPEPYTPWTINPKFVAEQVPWTINLDKKKKSCPKQRMLPIEEAPIDTGLEKNIIETVPTMSTEDLLDKAHSDVIIKRKQAPWVIDLTVRSPEVDSWIPEEEDMLFKSTQNLIYAPIHKLYGTESYSIDFFSLKSKRCYNSDDMRNRFVHYINYFEKFYDKEHELFIHYANLKYLIDYVDQYTVDMLIDDIFRYIFNPKMLNNIKLMVQRNYKFKLNNGSKTNNISLQYTDTHALLLLNFSIMQKLTIPLITHYITQRCISGQDINDTLMSFYYRIFAMFKSINMIAKLYESVMSYVKRSVKKNSKLWNMQNIRSINQTTHSIESVESIPLQVIPKYTFIKNVVSFNFTVVKKTIGYKLLNISYGYVYVPLSSSLRDEDNNSKIDKYEANLEKTDEGLRMFLRANKQFTLDHLIKASGIKEITDDEVEFYKRELSKYGDMMNRFQQDMVNLSVYKFFGDSISSKFTNRDEYVKMMIVTKRLMEGKFAILHEIIGGRVARLVDRKSINKKEMEKFKASPTWKKVQDLYRNPAKEDQIMSNIAVLLSSEFEYISYDNPVLNGCKIDIIPEVIGEEFMEFCLMVGGPEDRSWLDDSNVVSPLPKPKFDHTPRELDKYYNKAYITKVA